MRAGLTPMQARVLAAVRRHIDGQGHAPSYQEIAAAVGLRSRGNVATHVNALVERGHLRRLAGRARSLAVVETARTCPRCGTAVPALRPGGRTWRGMPLHRPLSEADASSFPAGGHHA